MHREIDSYTDSNSIVSRSKWRLGKKGYLKGVVIDVVYDHLLTKTWDTYSKVGKDQFISDFNANALVAIKDYPEKPGVFVNRLVHSGHLSSYSDLDGVKIALRRIDKRLSQNLLAKESASDYIPAIQREIDVLEEDFNAFFPMLITHFKAKSEFNFNDHWLR